ncbi:MAG: prolyl oligopeptidase family serine peptidase, partial [Bacteroidota bacterium]
YYSNEDHVTKHTPPTFLVHATDDAAVPVKNSVTYYAALQQMGVVSELHIYNDGGHGFGLANGKGHLETWKELCISWINNLE